MDSHGQPTCAWGTALAAERCTTEQRQNRGHRLRACYTPSGNDGTAALHIAVPTFQWIDVVYLAPWRSSKCGCCHQPRLRLSPGALRTAHHSRGRHHETGSPGSTIGERWGMCATVTGAPPSSRGSPQQPGRWAACTCQLFGCRLSCQDRPGRRSIRAGVPLVRQGREGPQPLRETSSCAIAFACGKHQN